MLCERVISHGMPCSVQELRVSAHRVEFKEAIDHFGIAHAPVFGIEGWAIVEGLNVSTTVSGTKPYFTCSVSPVIAKPPPSPPSLPFPSLLSPPPGGPIANPLPPPPPPSPTSSTSAPSS